MTLIEPVMTPHGTYDNIVTAQREVYECGVLVGVASWKTLLVRPWQYYNDLPRVKESSHA